MFERTDLDSTLIRRGRSALSVSEMVAFVETLEALMAERERVAPFGFAQDKLRAE